MTEAAIRAMLEEARNTYKAGKAKEQFPRENHKKVNDIQVSLMKLVRESKGHENPFTVERRKSLIANLFTTFVRSGDPVTDSLVHAFALLINP